MRRLNAGQPIDRVVLQNLHGDERQQADQRAHAQRDLVAADVQLVVVEAVLLVPQAGAAERVHRVGDVDEVLEELRRHVLVGRLGLGELERHREHRRAEEGHPRRAVGLLEVAARRQRLRAIEHADVVEAEEAAGEEVVAPRRPCGSPTR